MAWDGCLCTQASVEMLLVSLSVAEALLAVGSHSLSQGADAIRQRDTEF